VHDDGSVLEEVLDPVDEVAARELLERSRLAPTASVLMRGRERDGEALVGSLSMARPP
jgi:hypothetical protein